MRPTGPRYAQPAPTVLWIPAIPGKTNVRTTDRDFAGTGIATRPTANLMRSLAHTATGHVRPFPLAGGDREIKTKCGELLSGERRAGAKGQKFLV
jgi:hypothetical protein